MHCYGVILLASWRKEEVVYCGKLSRARENGLLGESAGGKGRLKLTYFQSYSMDKYCFFVHFQMFFLNFRCEITEKFWNEQKRLKTTEKSVLTSFWLRAAPESWSKCTTAIYSCSNEHLNSTHLLLLSSWNNRARSPACWSRHAINHLQNAYRKDTETLYHSFMYSLVSFLSRIYPLPAMHSLLVTLCDRIFNKH